MIMAVVQFQRERERARERERENVQRSQRSGYNETDYNSLECNIIYYHT